MSTSSSAVAPPDEVGTSLFRGISWHGAFVMGLAGCILVTGITPFAVQAMGAAAIPCLIGIQLIGMLVCLCMAELATLWPERTGGTPSYTYDSFKPLGEKTARHVGGITSWSYWLGWFPAAPINMILAASYIAVLFHLPLGRTVDPIGSLGTAEPIGVLIITLVGLLVLFLPCWYGIRLGTGFATLLGVTAMVPLTLLVLLPIFKPSSFHWHFVSGFHYLDPKDSFAFLFAWLFVISWNGIGVESASCYVAELKNPHRDAKIALTAEGAYSVFIFAATAIVFVAVLGTTLKSDDPLTEYTNFASHIFGHGTWVEYIVGVPLIAALLLTTLNAIMATGRSLFEASDQEKVLPKFLSRKNKHHVPSYAMIFNLICAMLVGLLGSPVRIYIFSNVGYLEAIIVCLFGYFLVRQFRKDQISQYRLHSSFKWIALVIAIGLTFIYFAGGWNSPNITVGPGSGHALFILGFAVVAAYVPLYWWRKLTDRRRGEPPLEVAPIVEALPGNVAAAGVDPEPAERPVVD
jgi:amino acid transporter